MKILGYVVTASVLLFISPSAFPNEGSELFNQRCNQCHKLPKIDEKTPFQLSITVDIMQRIMKNREIDPPTEGEKTQLFDYLITRVKSPEAITENRGEDTFIVRCGMCHQPPEAEMFKLKQWELVLHTMDQRMRHVNVPQLDKSERELILEYLAQHARK